MAVIMMTDIVGFTKLTRQQGDLVRELSLKHKNVIKENVSLHHGKLIHIFGDSSLSVFSDAVDAVKCSIEIQQSLNKEPVIPLRIALHHGKVTTEGEEIYGDALNITSRILKIAISFCILISDKVKNLLVSEPGIQTRLIGIYNLKHVDYQVEIFGICNDFLVLPEAHNIEQAGIIHENKLTGKGERLLAAIMFTDMVGYTALMQEDEQKAKKNRDRHRKILQESITKHKGKTLQFYGDGTLSIFNSSIEAVDCAIQIQQELQTEPNIPLRIGIHTGDIVYDDEGIYGDGVNVASRIEGLAVAGSVLISGKVFDDIKNHHAFTAVTLGAFDLKNVKKPLEIYAISNKGLVVPTEAEIKNKHRDKKKSLAILPFVNFSSDPENEFFSDGISEAIINTLTQLEGLFVTARTSSFSFKGQNKDIRELGKILGVVYILEGSVQRYKNKIRVTAQLIDTISGFHIFSEAFDRELIDVFSIQDDIAWLIAEKLREKINLDEKHQLTSPKTESIKALDYYMRGSQQMNTGAHPNILKAMELFQQSIESDPDFVLPYTGMCMCYTFLGAWGFIDETESNRKSNEYALKALDKDPKHPKALVVHALSSFWNNNWDLKNFESAIRKALKIAPGSSEVRLFHGIFMFIEGNIEDALIEILLAKKLDPLNSNIHTRLGYAYLCLKDFDKARDCFRKAHESVKLDMYFQFMIAWSYLIQNRYDQAESALKKVDEDKDGYQLRHGTEGYLHAKQGRLDLAYDKIQLINDLGEQGKLKFPNYNYTLVYAGLNKLDEMFYHLEKAFKEKPVSLMFIRADPFWEQYRHDKRYINLVNRVFNRSSATERITLHSETNETLNIQSDCILFIKAEVNYSRIVWIEGNKRKEKVLRATLKTLEEQLSGTSIIRCHRSYLFNASKYSLSGDSRGFKLRSESDPFEVPVARSKSKEIMNSLKQ
ncbi:MAG: LytTR family transcriptional regulator DNA-binding domain-containing protein [Bacteroidales bacterium]|nr:LytTR family transcriptional regulator DNA-binding domain-containing protein [Bacteroidales bacterium]